MRVYISGPITGLPIEEARLAFKCASDALAAQGYEPVNPCELPTSADCCPDATSNDGSGSGHSWSCYMRKDIAALTTCDAIFMLPGWQGSHGARREFDVANTLGLSIMFPQEPSWVRAEHPAIGAIEDILAELLRAEAKFPDQHLPDGTGGQLAEAVGALLKAMCQGNGPERDTWMAVLGEEVGEAFAETHWPPLRAELVQVGAMVLRWILDGDRREAGDA